MSVLPDPRTQVRPAGALDDLRAIAIPRAHGHRHWEPSDGPLPALFVSHGAPPTLDDAEWLGYLYKWSQSLPKPRAVVMISAHWENAPVAISASEARSEEHTSELQSRGHLVCRLLLEKKI